MVNKFDKEYAFLSNFYMCNVTYKDVTYTNSEAAFHAQKTLDPLEQQKFAKLNPSEAKKLGRKVTLRGDWEAIKDDVMYDVCFAKFSQNSDLREKLLATGDEYLEEGTYWHDNCWGNCYCDKCKDVAGENRLGKILMRIREELRD